MTIDGFGFSLTASNNTVVFNNGAVGIFRRDLVQPLRVHVADGNDFIALRRTREIALALSTCSATDRRDG